MHAARLLAVVALLALAGGACADEPVLIRTGYTVVTSGFTPMVLEKKDVLTHLGTSYRLEPNHFRSTSLELAALAAGEVDMISIAYSTFALAVLNADMADIRIVADGGQDGVDGHRSVPFLVRNDSGIARIEDLYLHQERFLSRPRAPPAARFSAAQCRGDARVGLHQGHGQRAPIRRSEPCRGSGRAAQMNL